MAADETPAQLPRVGEGGSTVGGGETPAEPTVGRCSDQCPTIHGIIGPLCALRYGHLGSHESEHGTIWSFMPGVATKPAAQPAVAPAPDGANTGGAGADVYLGPARAGMSEGTARVSSAEDWFRRIIDAARAPLLAQIATYESAWSVAEGALAEAIRERDEALHVLRQFADDEPCHFDHDGNCQAHRLEQAPCSTAEARRLTRFEEARAKTDGGEWQWGWAWPGTAPDWTHSEAVARQAAAARRPPADVVRRWIGPVEPVTDDGGAG